MSNNDFIESFKSAIADTGLVPPSVVVPDGEIHRFSSSGKASDSAGYYAFFINPDGSYGGAFGCWREGVKETWAANVTSSVDATTDAFRVDIMRQIDALEREAVHSHRVAYAHNLYDKATDVPSDHPYVARKGIKLLGDARYIDAVPNADFFMDESKRGTLSNCLLIPVYSDSGDVQSLQVITSDGKKFFMKGGKLDGGRFTFQGGDSEVYVCEGYATGATVHEATGATVVVAFNAGGLEKIVPNVVNYYPDSKVIIAADNDHRKAREGKGNKGLEVAKSTAEKLKVAYTLPTFEEADTGTDWNDYGLLHGIDATTKALLENEKVVRTFANFDETIKALLADTNDEEAFDAAICFVKDATSLQVGRLRARLKDVTGVNVGDINKAVAKKRQEEEVPSLTHGEIANEYIAQYNKPHPVCEHGYLWAYCKAKGIWQETPLSKIGVEIAEQFKHEALCQREGDYKAIASHTYNTLEQKGFFDRAPKGIHIPSGFLFVAANQLKKELPSPQHRARFRLTIEPDLTRQPEMLLQVLREAFEGCHAEEQIRQLRMMSGLALFGLQTKEQRAVLLYGAAGSGKSLFLKLIEALVPKEYRTSVSPLHMDSDYKNAALAGKLMNLVPEIDKDKPVPSAEFKAITGGDTMPAREPYGKVFTFTPEAACWFNGNYYLTTKDNSEGFWRRWTIFHFANSKPEQSRDPKLLAKIVELELPAFLAWAIEGVQDYLANGLFLSPVHHACIQEWKRDGNSVSSWLSDMEDNGVGVRKQGLTVSPLRVSHAYSIYKDWCRHNNRKPYNKTAFKGHMESGGHPGSMYNGYSSYIGLYDDRSVPGAMVKAN